MRKIVALILLVTCGDGAAQDGYWHSGMTVSLGGNYSVIRRGDQESMPGFSFGTTLFFRFQKKRSAVFFEPAIWFGKNTIRSRATPDIHVAMKQYGIGLSPAGGLMVGGRSYVKAGLLGEYVGYPMVEAVSSSGVHLGHSAFLEHFQKRAFLTAMTIAVGTSAGESKPVEIFFAVHQYLQCPFLQPFHLDALGAAGEEVFNAKALSTVLLGGISFKFLKPKKKVEE